MRPSGDKSLVLKKGAWSNEEDMLLKKYIQEHGEGKWHLVSLKAGLNRCRKSCRLRWINYLSPNIKRGNFEEDEVDLMHRLHGLLGNRWSLIAGRIPGRTANDVKNYWNTHVQPRHKPQKQELQNTVSIIRPQPHSLSKTLNLYHHGNPLDTGNLITSSNVGFSNTFNTSPGLVSSPTISADMINEYLEMEGLDRVDQEVGGNNLFNFPFIQNTLEDQVYK